MVPVVVGQQYIDGSLSAAAVPFHEFIPQFPYAGTTVEDIHVAAF